MVEAMQATSLGAAVNPGVGQAASQELRRREHTVISLGGLGDAHV